MKLKILMKRTPADIKERALKYCNILKFKKLKNKSKIKASVKCLDSKRKLPKAHTVEIWLRDKKEGKFSEEDVKVSCDCEYFMYNLEVALTKHRASIIKHSNGKLPAIKNPKMIPYLCKHLYLVATKIVKEKL